ncbi:transcription factor MYB44-like [Ananas comosus]|uniref:Transcription factor MYB44-like n=1 Tax=Ananas comosus TaxID=4615 RepID=A0A6P5GH60_ANACO|nr:transcription factor MYB44-like [Ananas comosus]
MALSKHTVLTSSPSSAVCASEAKKEKGSQVPWSPPDAKKDKGSKVPWSPHEDKMLRALVKKHGAQSWSIICRNIPGRSAKSCRLRWCNHLLPGLNFKPFTPEEDSKIIELHRKYHNGWATIARHMPGRSDNAIKNRWNCTLKNRQRHEHEQPTKRKRSDDDHDDDGFGSKVAESWLPPKTPQWEEIEPAEICEPGCVSQKPPPPLELNFLAQDFSRWKKQVFDRQRDFTGFKFDHGIDDPMTALTLGYPGTPTESYSSDFSDEGRWKMESAIEY